MIALYTLARQAIGLAFSRGALALTAGLAAADVGIFGGERDLKKRRRRRRALTASDKADIAFISGTLGKPAGRDFAMIVAART